MRFFASLLIALCCWTTPSFALGYDFNLVDDGIKPARGALQLVLVEFVRAPDNPNDFVCVAYVGNYLFRENTKRLVDMADQVFEEIIGAECWKYSFKAPDGKWHNVARCFVTVGDRYVVISDRSAFKEALIRGTLKETLRVEYRLKNDVGVDEQPHRGMSQEYVRVSQPEIPVGPSLREPNTNAVATMIEPGVSIGLENTLPFTYFGDDKPTFLIFYQTTVPLSDKPMQHGLAEKVVRALAGERLERRELDGVTIGTHNEPKRSRFHFRPSYRYDTDEKGKMTNEN